MCWIVMQKLWVQWNRQEPLCGPRLSVILFPHTHRNQRKCMQHSTERERNWESFHFAAHTFPSLFTFFYVLLQFHSNAHVKSWPTLNRHKKKSIFLSFWQSQFSFPPLVLTITIQALDEHELLLKRIKNGNSSFEFHT